MKTSESNAQTRLYDVAAAWEVWGERQHAVRRLVRSAEWSGDLPDGAQRRDLQLQYEAQLAEAYARSRVQCAIVDGVDGVDQVADFNAHWRETWGDGLADKVAEQYNIDFALALERQADARRQAAEQTAAAAAHHAPQAIGAGDVP